MTDLPSRRMTAVRAAKERFWHFLTESDYAKRRGEAGIIDLSLGDPHEVPPAGFVEALSAQIEPRHPAWYAYTTNLPEAQQCVAESLRAWRGLPFEADDIAMTTGAFGAIAAGLYALLDPGDEVIINTPPWFNYEAMIVGNHAVPVKVALAAPDFELDLDAIEAAITPQTRIVVVNTPHNPTGRIYPATTLAALAEILEAASVRQGRRIYLLSDEPYSRVVFPGVHFESPTAYYPHSFITYSYGKVLLAPGQRLGWLALSPLMPADDRALLRASIIMAQVCQGFVFPNALMQYALPALDKLSIDLTKLTAKRDCLVGALRSYGYELAVPQGTFYLLPKAPGGDDEAFCAALAARGLFVMPGQVFGLPGYFRITFTATEDMIEQALPIFEAVMKESGPVPSQN